jgi:hypothetical protein
VVYLAHRGAFPSSASSSVPPPPFSPPSSPVRSSRLVR